MNTIRVFAIGLVIAGVLALAYGGFTYTRETHETDIGPIHMSFADKKTVNIPIWAGIAAIVAGGLILVLRKPN